MKNLELRDQNNVRGKWLKACLVMLGINFLMAIAGLVLGEMTEAAIILLFSAINFGLVHIPCGKWSNVNQILADKNTR